MIYSYDLTGLKIQIECPEGVPFSGALEQFRGRGVSVPDAVYHARWYDGLVETAGTRVVTQWGYTVDACGSGYVYRYNVGYTRNPYEIILRIDPAKQEYELLLPKAHRPLLCSEGIDMAPLLAQELLFIRNGRLMIHASFVRCDGRGILFTGPSGMGKSTQAGLWHRYLGAQILNGDKTVLQLGVDRVTAWGSPYAGTSGIYRNENAPAAAIVALRQGRENLLRRLQGREALLELMPRMATALWADKWHIQAMDLAIALVERVPVYLLTCRPDAEAVELVRREIFRKEHL